LRTRRRATILTGVPMKSSTPRRRFSRNRR
jgi:hypothetical protein